MTHATQQEKAYWRDLESGERYASRQEERREELEMTAMADAMVNLIREAEKVLESRTSSEDERSLAEKIIDALGDAEDLYMISEIVR